MALRFTIEKLERSIRFRVKGVEIELAYHAASALCNAITEACSERKEFQRTKYKYWEEQARKGMMVKVNQSNEQEYNDYLESLGIDIASLTPSCKGTTGKRWAKDRKEAKAERWERIKRGLQPHIDYFKAKKQ